MKIIKREHRTSYNTWVPCTGAETEAVADSSLRRHLVTIHGSPIPGLKLWLKHQFLLSNVATSSCPVSELKPHIHVTVLMLQHATLLYWGLKQSVTGKMRVDIFDIIVGGTSILGIKQFTQVHNVCNANITTSDSSHVRAETPQPN